ncbi:Protoporphyrinogen IX dehydrogenase [menaquinone] [Marinomonas spartinae]|uniref:Protoporphyrinogen IX dehydrogenase [quinone] n=2 Tax=Marinomonas spartinae TaxID=1792290 RepID=A0A1A8TD61_9GAMM|nr:Protoporphyrinogen IX dehydrogenase [menaquinone] [Marinomonas spartinae]SBS36350.1 Protoporphyrinogen IX dehydrogenase [menaquinone] [Marinomonas spartinae]
MEHFAIVVVSIIMKNTLILYSSVDGHTLKICDTIARHLEQQGHRAHLIAIEQATTEMLIQYGKIVIGASIRYGKHRKNLIEFIRSNKAILDDKTCCFFSVNLVARKADKNTPETNPYLQKLLQKLDWQPSLLSVFAGKVDYQKYAFFDRIMIQLIMWMTKGPTDINSVIDYTDWQAVGTFSQQIAEH